MNESIFVVAFANAFWMEYWIGFVASSRVSAAYPFFGGGCCCFYWPPIARTHYYYPMHEYSYLCTDKKKLLVWQQPMFDITCSMLNVTWHNMNNMDSIWDLHTYIWHDYCRSLFFLNLNTTKLNKIVGQKISFYKIFSICVTIYGRRVKSQIAH